MIDWQHSLDRSESSAEDAWNTLLAFAQFMKAKEPIPPKLRDYIIKAIDDATSCHSNDEAGNDKRSEVLLRKLNIHALHRRPVYKDEFLREANESIDENGRNLNIPPSGAAKQFAKRHGLKPSSARKFVEADRANDEQNLNEPISHLGFLPIFAEEFLPQVKSIIHDRLLEEYGEKMALSVAEKITRHAKAIFEEELTVRIPVDLAIGSE